jgi:hypothetical protein
VPERILDRYKNNAFSSPEELMKIYLTGSHFFSSELPYDHVQNSIGSNRKHYG